MRKFYKSLSVVFLGCLSSANYLGAAEGARGEKGRHPDYYEVVTGPCIEWQPYERSLIFNEGGGVLSYRLASHWIENVRVYFQGQKIDEFKRSTPQPTVFLSCNINAGINTNCIEDLKKRISYRIESEKINNCPKEQPAE